MRKICIVLIATSSLLAWGSRAQDTNTPLTGLETFEAQTGTVIVKGAGQTGSLTVGALGITVLSKESLDVNTGQKAYGVAIEMTENNRRARKAVIDYDELDAFLSGLDYLMISLPDAIDNLIGSSGEFLGNVDPKPLLTSACEAG